MADETRVLKVAVAGAAGRMGTTTVQALALEGDFEVVCAVDRAHAGESLRSVAGPKAPDIPIREKFGAALDETKPDVLIDFTTHASAVEHAASSMRRGVAPVIGATGLTQHDLSELRRLSEDTGVPGIYVPNFAIGAVLMMRFAELASRWLPDVEIVEMHHDRKLDAPSGTAILTADLIAEARKCVPTPPVTQQLKVEGARGGVYKDIPIHSVRLPGLVAHQAVLFGGKGELLTIRHDSLDRSSFMEGVKIALRHVRKLQGFSVGLDKILFRS
ncbi:MAG: 4-hydroxy-tetrahydrodipicolinate reductase [Fimbriimonadales bacterium]|nr:4-hydroxy-tetrahydrodipicolinate reductase [Fimbriimonadales bacterium]